VIRCTRNLVGVNVTLYCDAPSCEHHLNTVLDTHEDLNVSYLREYAIEMGWGWAHHGNLAGKILDWCPGHKDQRGETR